MASMPCTRKSCSAASSRSPPISSWATRTRASAFSRAGHDPRRPEDSRRHGLPPAGRRHAWQPHHRPAAARRHRPRLAARHQVHHLRRAHRLSHPPGSGPALRADPAIEGRGRHYRLYQPPHGRGVRAGRPRLGAARRHPCGHPQHRRNRRGRTRRPDDHRTLDQIYHKERIPFGPVLLETRGLSGKGFADVSLSVRAARSSAFMASSAPAAAIRPLRLRPQSQDRRRDRVEGQGRRHPQRAHRHRPRHRPGTRKPSRPGPPPQPAHWPQHQPARL